MTISWKATASFMVHCHCKERKNIEKPFEIFTGGFRTIKYIKRDQMLMTLEESLSVNRMAPLLSSQQLTEGLGRMTFNRKTFSKMVFRKMTLRKNDF
jgi:hypothetical protein